MIIHPTQPLLPKKMMTPRPMSHATHQPLTMGTSRPNRIKPAGTQPPNRHATHIKLRPPRHPIQDTVPKPIRRLRVRRVRRTVRRTGNLADHRRPTAAENLVRALAVVGSVAVQSGHEEDDGDAVLGACLLRKTDVERDGCAVGGGGVRVGDYFFFQGGFPERGGLEVDVFLALEGGSFERCGCFACGAYVGEAGDAEDDGGAAVEIGGAIVLVVVEG